MERKELLLKLKLKNFQSHKDSTLDIEPFTVIVGHSSSGKSAVVRAFKTILYNIPSKSFIRSGTKKLEIELELDDESRITYVRDSSVSYSIGNGPELKAVGRDQLPQIADMGFQPIDIEKKKYYPQLSQQWDSPFLISFTDSEVSRLLSALSQAGKIKSAKTRMLKDNHEMQNTLSIRQIDREALQTKLVGLGDLEGQEKRLAGLLESRNKVLEAQKKLERVLALRDEAKKYESVPVPTLPENPSRLIELERNCQFSIVSYKVPENPASLIKLQKVVFSAKVGVVPDISKLKNAFELLGSLDKARSAINSIKFEDFGSLKSEQADLERKIHELSSLCPECGQILPEKSEKTPAEKIG